MVHYNSYNQAKSIQTVSDIIGFGVWQLLVFAFITIHSLYLPAFDHGIAFFDIHTTYECASGNETTFEIESFVDELGFSRQRCGLRSSDCGHFQYSVGEPYKTSLIQTLELPCERTWLRHLAPFAYQLGCLFSIILYFLLCKRFGRACLARFALLLELVANVVSSFVFNFYGHLFARFFLGVGSFGCFLLMFILLMEIVSKKIRSEICILVQLGWTLGNLMLTLVMTLLLDSYVQLERCLIVVQALLLVWSCFLKESPKWLLLNGHYTQAEKTLAKAGKNFDKLTNYEIKGRLMLLREHLIEEVNQRFSLDKRARSSKEQYQLILRTLSLVLTWFIGKLIYSSVTYYPELFTRKNGDFLGPNASYQSLVELISFVFAYVLVKFAPRRRVHILVFALFFVSISMFGELLFFKLNYFQNDMNNYYFKLAFMLVIKFATSLLLQFLLLFTGECFNENMHQKIYGYALSFGFVGAGLASFLPLFIGQFGLTSALVLLGVLALLNLFSVIWLPEFVQTSNEPPKSGPNPKRLSELTNMEDSLNFSFRIEE